MKSLSIDTDSIVEREIQRGKSRHMKRGSELVARKQHSSSICRSETRGIITRENSASTSTVPCKPHRPQKKPAGGCFGVVWNCFR